ncbi:MAG: hypothetical protein DRR04_14985 [Gammaproteobacteria bacterium]|nr:MAG: hypothetical protein DRR04_14985 [Gammaproteobacteria bacterium]
MLVISLFVVPVFWYRTVLPAMVPIIGFAAVMITSARTQKARVVGGLAVAVLIVFQSTGWVANRAAANYENWSDVGTVVEKLWRPGIAVCVYPDYILPAFELTCSVARSTSVTQVEIASGLSEFKNDNHYEGVILVSRWDVHSRADATREKLPEILGARYGEADYDHQFGVLKITRFMRIVGDGLQGDFAKFDPSPEWP